MATKKNTPANEPGKAPTDPSFWDGAGEDRLNWVEGKHFAQPQADHIDDRDIEKKWEDIKPSYRKTYPNLTEEDVSYREGEFDDMTQRIAEKTNRSRDQILQEILDWRDEDY